MGCLRLKDPELLVPSSRRDCGQRARPLSARPVQATSVIVMVAAFISSDTIADIAEVSVDACTAPCSKPAARSAEKRASRTHSRGFHCFG